MYAAMSKTLHRIWKPYVDVRRYLVESNEGMGADT